MPAPEGALAGLAGRLAAAGCVAPLEEAAELTAAAGADPDALEALVARREEGVPLAWLTGGVDFCGVRVRVDPGVYVPRHQTELLTRRAVARLAPRGVAVDLCTGSGAVAAVLQAARPAATVHATDIDPAACRCARANGVAAREGFLADPLPPDLDATVDVVTAVVPYVPTDQLAFLPRDVRDHEPAVALDGGPGGTRLLEAAVAAAGRLLRPGGTLLVEVGGDQDGALAPVLRAAGFAPARALRDEDGDLRALEAALG